MCVDDISFKHRRRYPGRYDYSLHSFKAIQPFSVSWIGNYFDPRICRQELYFAVDIV